MVDFSAITFSKETVEESRAASKPLRYKPIPAGTYNFRIYEIAVKEFGESSKNAGKSFLSVDLLGLSGEAEKKHLFPMVPLFANWAVSTDPEKAKKHPNGFPTNFIAFLEALGEDVTKKGYKFTQQRLDGLLSKTLSAVITVAFDDYKFNKELEEFNEDALRLVELRENENLTPEETAEKVDLEEIYSRNDIRTFKPENKALSVDTSENTGFGAGVVFDA